MRLPNSAPVCLAVANAGPVYRIAVPPLLAAANASVMRRTWTLLLGWACLLGTPAVTHAEPILGRPDHAPRGRRASASRPLPETDP